MCTFNAGSVHLDQWPASLRILQISSAQSLGGGERHLVDLAKGLVSRGHEVDLALRPKSPLIQELHSIPAKRIHTLALRNALDVPSARELARLVNKNKIQIVHAHMARDYPLAAYAARRNAGARLIVTRHVMFALNPLHRVTLSGAARIIAVSPAVSSKLISDGIGEAGKINVVLNGIEIAQFQQARNEFDRQRFLTDWKLSAAGPVIGTIGELTPLKGQEEFLQAAAIVAKQFPSAQFIVAGVDHAAGKKHEKHLRKLINDLGLLDSVKLVGWVDNLTQLYCGLDVLVSSSRTESFGLVLAEAMASGTVVVATATDGARELIKTNETGLLVSIGNVEELAAAIVQTVSDTNLRAEFARAAQQVAAENFTLERMITETEKIYSEVLAAASRE